MFAHGFSLQVCGVARSRQEVRKTVLAGLSGLLLAFSWPQSGQASPLEEWEKLDVGTEQIEAKVEIQPGKSWLEPVSEMKMLWIPDGCFKMGSPPSVEGRDADEGPVHPVCLSGFWLGEREVTQGQWQHIMQQNPAKFRKDSQFPVEQVSRLDIETFTSRLNTRYQGRVVFGLPTEAQWEYACRSGGQKMVFAGYNQVEQLGWYRANSGQSTQLTRTRSANRLGLLDMSGNVWEWVQDTYDKATYGQAERLTGNPVSNPVHTGITPFSVIRGGGWNDTMQALRCANRGFENLTTKRPDLGVRLSAVVDFQVKTKEIQNQGSREMPF